MSTNTKKQQPEQIIPTEEVKKENTKGEKRTHGRTNKGTNATVEKDDRQNKTGLKKRDQNARRNEGTYIKKAALDNGELPPSDEEQKNDKGEKKQFRPRYEKVTESKFNWDKKAITLETVIPKPPHQKELLEEPKRETLNKIIDQIDAKIEDAKTKKFQKVNEIVNRDKTIKTNINGQSEPLHTKLKELFEKQKSKKAEHEAALAELEKKQELSKTIQKRSQDLRNKMKKCMTEKEINERLEELTFRHKNELLNNQQEKKLVQEIEDLKQSLPFSIPLSKLEEELRTAQKEEKAYKGKQGAAYKALKEVQEEINEVKKQLEEIKKLRETTQSGENPEIELAKKECSDLVDQLKKQKHEAYQKYDADRKAYQEQQELIRYVEYVKKQQDYLRKKEAQRKRDEERKRREEERLKREEEEKALEEQKKKSRYLVYVEIADHLINYLEKLSGKGDNKKDYVDQTETTTTTTETKSELKIEDLNKLLQKEKLTVLVSKKDKADQSQAIFGGHNKKNQKPKEQAQKQQEKTQEKNILADAFHHNYEIMEQFEKLAVAAPTFKSEIDKTISLLQEKKQYYIELPNKENGDATEEKNAEDKQDKKQKKQNKIEFDETAFPTIEN
ncbi:hypothetical protein TTHERM_01345770 (macronuclear) [Tetrahymena thermophila SB210]|uniref:Uncharacterized protein n=1 Tax=Tetrahymena thermophila (strain SB210) TaxID=312017 RepID=Q229R9_TETTS|nr:hypothetical protein TTHERM_01345770 [Tetrahymena thermophila SB210]EAR82031.2 hypothetical protein TTHERM_01345770 [Tetrahymena thermophila SB210]|eukprot:XP_001029695.2 hypothetical protein TTHERM_01345770 [Tetrahymena thermophila SB210]